MNQKEWKKLSREKHSKDFFKYRNKAEKFFNYKRNTGYVIHHLRDTPEQCEFNDKYYERWGFDFNDQMKYCICITIEEHRKIHTLSEETKKKISKSVSIAKTKLTDTERKQNKYSCDKRWKNENKNHIKEYKKQYYLKHKARIIENAKKHRNPEKNKEATRKWRLKRKLANNL